MKSQLYYGSYLSPWGLAGIVYSQGGIHQLFFCDNTENVPAMISYRYTGAQLAQQTEVTSIGDAIFVNGNPPTLMPEGTPFQQSVWQALLKIPVGTVRSYADIALEIGRPGAERAVGNAIGANPIAFLIPCHRVLRKNGRAGGYRWSIERKLAILKSEGVTVAL